MDAKQITILLADDTLIGRSGIRVVLETADDIEIIGEVEKNAHETLRKVKNLSPDIVLMDLKWFGDETAGWTAIKEIKSTHPGVKVIAVTAYEHLIKDARLAGADAALTKDFTLEQLLSLIRELAARKESFTVPISPTGSTLLDDLTPREQEVLNLLPKGSSDKEIAKILTIAENTVKNHVSSILSKLDAKNRTQAVSIARELGLLR